MRVERSASPGTYVLVMRVSADTSLTIGMLGTSTFHAGHYLYVGSALGPGGLAARLRRHGRQVKRHHWHIDHLLAIADLLETWVSVSNERCECRLAGAAMALPGCHVPVPRFGASDCRCPSHLFAFPQRPRLGSLAALAPWCVLEPGPELGAADSESGG